MLRVTRRAADLISDLVQRAELPDGGLRIAQQGGPGLTMELAPAPREEDDVLVHAGVALFLDPVAATRLRGQVLDARSGETGSAFFLGR
ncbi:MAG: HesB/IscA family protein [Mycobacteriales bacterium]